MPIVVAASAEGLEGVEVAAVVVNMAVGVEARFVTAKLNGPPNPPKVVFTILTVGIFVLMTLQLAP